MNGDTLEFLAALRRSPRAVGAIAPSGKALARELGSRIETGTVVVELGAGTGSVSRVLHERNRATCRLHYVERDVRLAALLSRRVPPDSVLVADVAALHEHFAPATVDHVVCGLPWTNFDEDAQHHLLGNIVALLRPGGTFSTFNYMHAFHLLGARRFRLQLMESFQHIEVSRPAIRNLPPALVLHCTRAGEAVPHVA